MPDDDGDDPSERLAAALRDAERLLLIVAALLATIGAAGLPAVVADAADDLGPR